MTHREKLHELIADVESMEELRRARGVIAPTIAWTFAQEIKRLDCDLFLAREHAEQNEAMARIGARAVRDLRLIHTIA